jgi:hypothetical protein
VSDELLNQPNQIPEDDVNTTPPNPGQNSAKSGWSMPEPVFRKTSGYLPQGFEKKFSQDEVKSDVDDDTSTASMSRPNELSDVEPQPEISEVIEEAPVLAAPKPEPKKGGAMKVIFSVFGILIALGLVLVFIAVVYYLFLMPSSSSTF